MPRKRGFFEKSQTPTAQVSRAQVEVWRKLLDPEETSEREFLELFKIKTDVVQDEDSETPTDPWVPFKWREVQVQEYSFIEDFQKAGKPTRLRIPKSRGHGMSSFNIALFCFCRPLRIPGYEAKVIAQDQDESEEHLSRLNDFFDQVDWAALEQLGITRVKSTRKSIVIQFGNMKRSKIRVMTARKQGLGRGGQSDAVITTERPHWPDKAKSDLTGVLSRLSRSRWSAHIDESSPNGHDSYFEDCMRAQDGRGGYKVLFLPSYMRPNNYIRDFDRAELLSNLGKREEYGNEEETDKLAVVAAYWMGKGGRYKPSTILDADAALEKAYQFLAWRRNAIDGECRGSLPNFWREHGTTLEEAFQGTGRPVFRLEVLKTWAPTALRIQEAAPRYSLEVSEHGLNVTKTPRGLWRVYELPQKDKRYCFAVDVAKGYQTLSDGTHEADWSVVNIKDVYSGRTVAKLREHIFPQDLAWEVIKGAHWYNDARGLPESNNDGGTVIAFVLNTETDWGEGGDCLMLSTRHVKTDIGPERRTDYGWNTNNKTKPYMVGVMHKFIEETGKCRDGVTCPWDYDTLQEMMLFVHGDRGKMEAERGHDDCVIAEGIALCAREMQIADGDVPVASKKKAATVQDSTDREFLEEMERTSKRGDSCDPVLGRQF